MWSFLFISNHLQASGWEASIPRCFRTRLRLPPLEADQSRWRSPGALTTLHKRSEPGRGARGPGTPALSGGFDSSGAKEYK